MRTLQLSGERDEELARSVGLDVGELEAMYRLLAIAKYDDRYVIPKAHGELAARLEAEHAGCSLEGGPMGGQAVDYGSVGYPPQRKLPSGTRLNMLRETK
jgi:nitrate reductase beta subunit